MLAVVTHGVDETRSLGEALAALLEPRDVIVLAGELGAGKTAMAQGIARGLGVDEIVASPTFVIVREYAGRCPMAHVDVYRLGQLQELHDLGFDELIDDGRVVVIEWGDRIAQLLPADRLDVRIVARDELGDAREIEFSVQEGWRARQDRLGAIVAPWVEV